jgi:hypothetical protein
MPQWEVLGGQCTNAVTLVARQARGPGEDRQRLSLRSEPEASAIPCDNRGQNEVIIGQLDRKV